MPASAGCSPTTPGRVAGVKRQRPVGGDELEVRAGSVIDATGVWLGIPTARLGGSTMKLVPSRGTHLVFERERLPLKTGMTLRIPGRVLFIIPHPGVWLVGTTDVADDGAARSADADASTRSTRSSRTSTASSTSTSAREDAVGAFAGLRPLVGAPGGDTARVSREHTIHREDSGLVRVVGRQVHDLSADGPRRGRLRARRHRPMPAEPDRGPAAHRRRTTRRSWTRWSPSWPATRAWNGTHPHALVERHGTRARDVVELGRELDLLRPLAADRTELEAEVAWAVRPRAGAGRSTTCSRDVCACPCHDATGAPRSRPEWPRIMGARLGWDAERQTVEVEAVSEPGASGVRRPRSLDRH